MGIIVDRKTNPFSELDNNPQTSIVATSLTIPHTIVVQSIEITNLGDADIGINLKFVRSSPAIEILLIKNFIVPHFNSFREFKDRTIFNSVDLVESPGVGGGTLQYAVGITDQLLCYSNGVNQKFNCRVQYLVLNET
jgi:hypothetical protein